MGKPRFLATGCGILLTAALLHSEQITAESNVFSFPAMVPVTMHRVAAERPYFRHTGVSPFARTVRFSWSLPVSAKKVSGTIVVYSLMGRVVARIPVTGAKGTAEWNLRSTSTRSGIYLAQIRVAEQTKNLKLMLWN